MKKLLLFSGLVFLILYSCEKGPSNDESTIKTPAALKHNSYVAQSVKPGANGMPELSISKNGEIQPESLGRLFCKQELFEMVAGQNTDAGWVIVSNDKDNLYVTYQSESGWKIKEIHLFAGLFDSIPLNKQKVPVPGLFPIKETLNPAVEMVTYEIPLKDLPECPVILAHAVVVREGSEETAWGKGQDSFEQAFGIKRWGWTIDFCPEDCEGKELVIASKSYVVDPSLADPLTNPVWWVVTKGIGSVDNCLGIGFDFFNTGQQNAGTFDLIKQGKIDDKAGTVAITITDEGGVKYVNVVFDLTDDNVSLYRTYMYIGSRDGLKNYYYQYQGKDCYNYYNWFFKKEEVAKTHTFKIALTDIKEK